jgi:hypothetical protein
MEYELVSLLWTKLKTPCFAGFLPVMNEVHAGGVIGGRTDSSVAEAPSFTSLANVGILPSAIQGRMSVQVAASSPMMTALGCFRERWPWFELNGDVVLLVEQHADLVSYQNPKSSASVSSLLSTQSVSRAGADISSSSSPIATTSCS